MTPSPTPKSEAQLALEKEYQDMHMKLMQHSKAQLAHWLLALGAQYDRLVREKAT